MGGDAEPAEVNNLSKWIHEHYNDSIKTCWYSGRDWYPTFVPDFDNFVLTPTEPGDTKEDMAGQLILTVTGPGIVGQFRHDFTDGENATPQPVAEDIEIPANAMGSAGHTYTANIEFVEIDKNQDANKSTNERSVSFFGHFEVTQKVTALTSSNP